MDEMIKFFSENKRKEKERRNNTSSKLLDKDPNIFKINSASSTSSKDKLCSLLIEGSCLCEILNDKNASQDFINMIKECVSVIVYRATPKEKGSIVSFVKSLNIGLTLAIGDGANDVSMIKQANVGIGIRGQEGAQAASNADFSIGEFKGLWRLLFVHGRLNCYKLSFLACYFYFKSALLGLQQILFAFHCGFSGQTIFDETVFGLYNAIFTTFPVGFYAIFDKDICLNGNNRVTSLLHKLYFDTNILSFKLYIKWFIYAIFFSVTIFYISVFSVNQTTISLEGRDMGLWFSSAISVSSVVILDYALLAINTNSWDIVIILAYIILGICLYIPIWIFSYKSKYFGDLFLLYTREGSFWYIILCCVCCCFIIYYIFESLIYHFGPSLTSKVLQKIHVKTSHEATDQLTMKILTSSTQNKNILIDFHI